MKIVAFEEQGGPRVDDLGELPRTGNGGTKALADKKAG